MEIFCPDEYRSSIDQIDFGLLKEQGIDALILDVDNTLVAWNDESPTYAMRQWVEEARQVGFQMCLVSNGLKQRVEAVGATLGIPVVRSSVKPRKKPFQQALTIMGVRPEQTAVVGDQIFTDIFGGNRMQLYTILINPVSEKEFCTTQIMRRLEKYVISRLRRKGLIS